VGELQHVHFVGIGGYGMSAIAKVMLDMGYRVSGSDVSRRELAERLAERGAKVYVGHEKDHVEGADVVVYSTALSNDNVELTEARARHIPVIHRSEMLARLMSKRIGVAVTGAHGKTTTTSMISYAMERCGLDPTFVVGGVVSNIGDNAKAGGGEYVVAEADESDGSFLHYRPQIAVITNIEADHLEHYDGKFENLKNAYATFIQQMPKTGLLIISGHDPHLRELRKSAPCLVQTYGMDSEYDYFAKNVRMIDRGSECDVYHKDEYLGKLSLSLPGVHNVMNAMAAIAVCLDAGIEFKQIAMALHEFHGAKRRFQVIAESQGILVIDDYAHHPTEISATITAAQATGRRIVAVFQPQRYTRTFFLFDAFANAFSGADEVVIADIYSPAGEQQIEGVSAEKLVEQIRIHSNENTQYLQTKDDVFDYLIHSLHSGDLVLTMGAGDIWQVAYRLGDALRDSESRAFV
jgi:UDP-N-acetylmuramate--alanine ligase